MVCLIRPYPLFALSSLSNKGSDHPRYRCYLLLPLLDGVFSRAFGQFFPSKTAKRRRPTDAGIDNRDWDRHYSFKRVGRPTEPQRYQRTEPDRQSRHSNFELLAFSRPANSEGPVTSELTPQHSPHYRRQSSYPSRPQTS